MFFPALHLLTLLQTLVDEHILSAPVLENGRFVGFLDMKDLTHYVVFAVDQQVAQERGAGVGSGSISGRRGSRGGLGLDGAEAEALHARHTPQHTASPAPSLPTVPATPSAEDVAAALARPSPLRDDSAAEDAQDGGDVAAPLPKHVQFLETAVRGLTIAHKDVGKNITNSCALVCFLSCQNMAGLSSYFSFAYRTRLFSRDHG